MSLHVEFRDDELPALQVLLNRALNCWDVKDAPPWAWLLEARVVARLNDLKRQQEDTDQTVVQR